MVACLGQGADLHMAQLMPLPLTISSPVNRDWLVDRTVGRAFGTVSRLSVCLSSVTFRIVVKRCVLAKKCLKE